MDDLPYFDYVIRRLELDHGDSELEKLLGRNVHWGYWNDVTDAAETADDFLAASDRLSAKLIEHIAPKEGQSILDAGCGFGGTIAQINERFDGLQLTGINIDSRQIERANQYVGKLAKPVNQIRFLVGDACRLPFSDGCFDAVVAVESIFHFPSRACFFKEVHRVLKPNGRLVLSDFIVRLLYFPIVGFIRLFFKTDSDKIYGRNTHVTAMPHYLWLARSTGFTLLADLDITRNTVPTYAILKNFASRMSADPRAFRNANRCIEIATKIGGCRYKILCFQRAG